MLHLILMTKFEALDLDAANDMEAETRRQFPRRACDFCVAEIDDQLYPVKDWSMGGVLMQADNRKFQDGKTYPLYLKFKLGEDVREVQVHGSIVRRSDSQMAVCFNPLTRDQRADFMDVILTRH